MREELAPRRMVIVRRRSNRFDEGTSDAESATARRSVQACGSPSFGVGSLHNAMRFPVDADAVTAL